MLRQHCFERVRHTSVNTLDKPCTTCCLQQGSWMCSLRGDCSWAILHSGSMSPIALLRLLRFFRIIWILKHVKLMRIVTLLGGLAVSAGGQCAVGTARWHLCSIDSSAACSLQCAASLLLTST